MSSRRKPLAAPSALLAEVSSVGRIIEVLTQGRVSSLADLDGDAEAISEAASFALITNALDGAIERYQSSIGNGTWMAARAAVGEALWWIASADEFLRFETEFPVHLLELEKSDAGRLLGALVFARNHAGHQLARLLVYSADVTYVLPDFDGKDTPGRVTMEIGSSPWATAGPLQFCSLGSLPSVLRKHRDNSGRAGWYEQEVAGRDAAEVLQVAADSLRLTLPVEFSGA